MNILSHSLRPLKKIGVASVWLTLLVFGCDSSGQSILLHDDFDSLATGTPPNIAAQAGSWLFPSDYESAGLAENDPAEYTIVNSPGGFGPDHGLQLQANSSISGNQHLVNFFSQSITQSPSRVIVVSFDLYVYPGSGGGTVYLGAGGSDTSQRGPQVSWNSSGQLWATEGNSITVLSSYPRGDWQNVRIEINLTDNSYNLYAGLRGNFEPPPSLVRANLRFRSGNHLSFLDRFTLARFTVDPEAHACYDNVSVVVGDAPSFLKQPGVEYLPPGQDCTNLSVVIAGTPPFSYQWLYYSNFSIPVALRFETSATLERCWFSSPHGPYSVLVSNYFGVTESTWGAVEFSYPAFISQHPEGQTVRQGDDVTLLVYASGGPPPTYQWQKNGTNLPGATASSLELANVQASDSGTYAVVVGNPYYGDVTSSNATLTVLPPLAPTITQEPSSQRVGIGDQAFFSVTVIGSKPLKFQWQKGGQPITDATNATLRLVNIQLSDAGQYSLLITNPLGSATSAVVSLTVDRLIGFESIGGWSENVFPRGLNGIAITNGLAYVAGSGGFAIFDLSNPTAPTLVGRIEELYGTSVFVAGDIAYVAAFDGLHLVNVANPTAPFRLGDYPTTDYIFKVWTSGQFAYLARYSGLSIIDVSNSSLPFQVANYPTIGSAIDVQIQGNYAFVGDTGRGLVVLNVSDKFHPAVVGVNSECANIRGLAVDGQNVFVADGFTGMLVVNISNPSSPVSVVRYLATGRTVEDVSVKDGAAYLTEWTATGTQPDGIEILNITNPGTPVALGFLQTGQYTYPGKVSLSLPYAYLLNTYPEKLLIANVTNAGAPRVDGNFELVGDARCVQVMGQSAYLAYGEAGLQILDISNPSKPASIGGCDTPGGATGVSVVGDYAYVADGDAGLQIISITNPAVPVRVGGYDTLGYARAVEVVGQYAYVADSANGLEIIDVANPASPSRVGGYPTLDSVYSVRVVGSRAYLAEGTSGFSILSLTNPIAPVYLGGYAVTNGSTIYQIEVAGNYGYVAGSFGDKPNRLRILNISNSSAPLLVGEYGTNGSVSAISIEGNYAYLGSSTDDFGEWSGGVEAVDISDPTKPFFVERKSDLGIASIQLSGPYIYAAGYQGLVVLGRDALVMTPPLITQQPHDRASRSGQAVEFSASATGSRPLGYQWTLHGSPIPFATNATLVLSNVQSAAAGNYALQVFNPYGFAISAAASLTVDDVPPRVTNHSPKGDLTVESITNALLSVDFWFSEAIDKTSLAVSNISFVGPTSQAIPVWSVMEVGLNRFRVGFPPQTDQGEYRLTISTNVQDFVSNHLTQPYVAILSITPGDLVITNISVSTNQFFVGDVASVSWQGLNTTSFPLRGNWTDGVYLSKDAQWDISDVLLASWPHTNGLASNEVYTAVTSFNVPAVFPANYYILVRADIENQTQETVETNNCLAFGHIPVTYHQLFPDGNFTGTFSSGNGYQYFTINLPAGESLRLKLHGLKTNAANQIYVSRNAIPYPWDSNEANSTRPKPDQDIVVSGTTNGGTYYVLVDGWANGSRGFPSSFELQTESKPFFVTGFNPAFLGNSTPAIVTLTGAGFDSTTTTEFISGNAVQIPSAIEVASPQVLRLSLTITNWLPGIYDVRITKGTNSEVLPGALTVLQGNDPQLNVNLILPSSVGFNIPVRQTLWIEYSNSGNVPMPAPLLSLSGDHSPRLTANPTMAVASRGNGVRFGASDTAQVLGTGSSQTPWLLMPGESGRIPVYYTGLAEEAHYPLVTFTLGSLPSDDTRPIQWDQIESTIRPIGVSSEQWSGVLANLSSKIGETWGSYHNALAQDTRHFQKRGVPVYDASKLWSFEVASASGALCPVRVLASSVDASAPSPGFPIVFRRVFGQPIPSRSRQGLLGRGWRHNWETYVEIFTNGTAAVRGLAGVDHFFTPESWSSFDASSLIHDGTPNYNKNYNSVVGETIKLSFQNKLFRAITTDKVIWQFDANKRLDYVQDPNGNRITCGYTAGRLTSLTHSSGKQLLLQYNGSGHLSQVSDAIGRATTYEYDGSGEHLIRVTAPGNRVTTYAYQTTGILQRLHALLGVTYPDLTQDSFVYDPQGRLIQTSQNCCGGAQQVTYSYDTPDSVGVTDATGRRTQLFYDADGRMIQARDGEGRTVNFDFNDTSRLSQLLGPSGEPYRYSYDDNGNLATIEDALHQENRFSYEPDFNRFSQVRDARGNDLQYGYDNRGNLTAVTYADNTRELFAYNSRGNVINSTNRRGQVITYAYNPAGQLTVKDYATTPGIMDFTYAYDSVGNLTNATYWNPQSSAYETNRLQYDPFTDRLTRIEYPGGRFFTFDYDAAGRRTRRADQDGHLTAYLYDTLGRLDRMTNGLGQLIVDYDYDAAGRLSRKTLGNGVFTTYGYNSAGQITNLVNYRADTNILSRFAYTYDAAGRRDSMTTLAGKETYGYDALGQLTRVTYPNSRVVTYAYDAVGNRTLVSDNGTNTLYAANQLNQYTSAGAATYGYDLDGNLTNKTEAAVGTTYTYDMENRLIGVATPADTWTYTYDAFGNRIATTHNGQTTRYVVDPTGLGNVAAEYDGGGSLLARYEHGFGLLSRSDAAGNPAFYTFSAIGHTSELTDHAGAMANSYSYDPFGQSLAKSETIANPFEFVGEFGVMNDANGLMFMRARYYESSLGKFLTADPLGILAGPNLYAYSGNNAVQMRDASGLSSGPDSWLSENRERNTLRGPFSQTVDPWREANNWLRDYRTKQFEDAMRKDPEWFKRFSDKQDALLDWPATAAELVLADGAFAAFLAAISVFNNLAPFITPDQSQPTTIPPPNLPTPPPLPGQSNTVQSVGSTDPNDKVGPASYGPAAFVRPGRLAYQVSFENLSSATAPAREVIVRDTFDLNVDLNTLELTEIAFGSHIITLPSGLTRYQAAMPLRSGNTDLQADVRAAVDYETRTLTLTLRGLDPQTGWFPEDPLVGLLPPEDGTGRGQGHITYIVKSSAGISTGTTITNLARIWFDYNDPIDTPLVVNTIDADTPTSAVAALAVSVTNASFLVSWSGTDVGSGIVGYDVYYSSNGEPWTVWQQNTPANSAVFAGVDNTTYRFYCVAHDGVGNIEAAPLVADAVTITPANSAPTLDPIGNKVVDANQSFAVTNFARDFVLPGDRLKFSLLSAPDGAKLRNLSPTNAVFSWTPACEQGGTTNVITVQVSDNGTPPLTATQTFVITVPDCVQVSLGNTVVRAGDSVAVPVELLSTVQLSNVVIFATYPETRLTNFTLLLNTQQVAAAPLFAVPSNGLLDVVLNLQTNHALRLSTNTATLGVTAHSNQSSAFVWIQLPAVDAQRLDGSMVTNAYGLSGRIVVVGEEPLLEALHAPSNQVSLLQYAPTGSMMTIQARTNAFSGNWQPLLQNTQSNLIQASSNMVPNLPMLFFRAIRGTNGP